MRSQDWVIEVVCDARALIATVVVGCTIAVVHLPSGTSIPQSAPAGVPPRCCANVPAKVAVGTGTGMGMSAGAGTGTGTGTGAGMGTVTGRDGRTYAVVALVNRRDECSGAGGEHYTLQIDEPGNAPRMVHAGGHSIYLGLDDAGWLDRSPEVLAGYPRGPERIELGQVGSVYFIAEIALRDARAGDHDIPGWCINDTPAYAGNVLQLLRASGRDEGRRRLGEIAMLRGDPHDGGGWRPVMPR